MQIEVRERLKSSFQLHQSLLKREKKVLALVVLIFFHAHWTEQVLGV